MSPISTFILETAGVSEEMLIILFSFPFIATIIGIARYYIGVKTFNLYSPILLTLAYYLLMTDLEGDYTKKVVLGGVLGVFFTTIVILTSIITHNLLKSIRLHFFPKISLGISLITIALTLTLIFLYYFELVEKGSINITSLVLIAAVSEHFINTYNKKNLKISLKLSIETILLSIFCYLFIAAQPVQHLLLNRPELMIINIPMNYMIGKFKGLRLNEMLRFRDILEDEENKK